MRTKAFRRHQTERVQRRRWLRVYHQWLRDALRDRGEFYPPEWLEKFHGQFRDSNGSCGCGHCNPHKIGYAPKLTARDLRRLDSVNDRLTEDHDDRSETDDAREGEVS